MTVGAIAIIEVPRLSALDPAKVRDRFRRDRIKRKRCVIVVVIDAVTFVGRAGKGHRQLRLRSIDEDERESVHVARQLVRFHRIAAEIGMERFR